MKIKVFCSAFLLLMFNVVVLYAQIGDPCGLTDPDASCPLDTWVIVLAFITVAFTSIKLYNKQNKARNIALPGK